MFYLAPLQGFTDHLFRNVFARHFAGIDLAIAPFVSLTEGRRIKASYLRDLIPENNQNMKIIPQVMGTDPKLFVTMAKAFEDLGYDSLNWNLGCPVRMIARKKRGCGLLPFPEEIDRILEEVLPKINIGFSIKSRLGYHSAEEIYKVMEVYNRYPLDFLVLHPRIGLQMYEGGINYQMLDYCLEQSKHPIVYSGDIWTAEIFDNLQNKYPQIKDWMLGRGLIKDLFLAEKIRGVFDRDKNPDLRFWNFQFDLLETLEKKMNREKNALNKTKEYWTTWAEMFESPKTILDRIYPIFSVDEMRKLFYLLQEELKLRP
jgi:tRNA-dihydrouridine synthase B